MLPRFTIWRGTLLIVATIVFAIGLILAVPSVRVPVLRAIGETLIAEQRAMETVDVIVVAVDAGSAGVLEAADLVHAGVATRVAVFSPRPGKVDEELLRRGVEEEDAQAWRIRQLASLGVTEVMSTPRVSGTEEQGHVLPQWCEQHGIRSLVVVTSWYHSRRVGRVLERSMGDREIRVAIHVARYADFEPENWWQSRDGARAGIMELQKLLLDVVRHPLS